MHVLIIGGTKFVGYHIARRLLADGHKVALFNRGRTPDDFGRSVERCQGDRRDDDHFCRTFKGRSFDAVVDVIGYKAENIETAIKTFQGQIGHYIFISSGQVYLVTENRRLPSREDDFDQPVISCPPGEEDSWFYGMGKRGCETALLKAHSTCGFPVTIFRLPIIHGERDHTLRAYSYFSRIADEGPIILPDGGETVIRHVYVGDLALQVGRVIGDRSTLGQAYNLAQKEVLDLKGFVEVAAALMKKKVKFVFLSSQELMMRGLDLSFSPFSSRWVSYLDTAKAELDLGFRATGLRRYLKKTINWFLDEYRGEKPANLAFRAKEIEIAEAFLREI